MNLCSKQIDRNSIRIFWPMAIESSLNLTVPPMFVSSSLPRHSPRGVALECRHDGLERLPPAIEHDPLPVVIGTFSVPKHMRTTMISVHLQQSSITSMHQTQAYSLTPKNMT